MAISFLSAWRLRLQAIQLFITPFCGGFGVASRDTNTDGGLIILGVKEKKGGQLDIPGQVYRIRMGEQTVEELRARLLERGTAIPRGLVGARKDVRRGLTLRPHRQASTHTTLTGGIPCRDTNSCARSARSCSS